MSRPFWRAGEHISIVYRSGGYTHNLHASDFVLEASTRSIVLSIDVGRNERARNKDTNRYLDAKELRERYSDLKQVQIRKHKSLTPFYRACDTYKSAPMELELRFDGGLVHRLSCDLRIDEWNLWFGVQPSSERTAERG
jgi:hypothetical protein